MGSSRKTLVIDATRTGALGAWAAQPVNGRPVLAHHVALAQDAGCEGVSVHVSFDDMARLTAIAESAAPASLSLRVTTERAARGQTTIRTDRLYAPRRFRSALKAGRSTDAAIIWRLDAPSDLEAGGAELLRRTSYQPLGTYWAWKPARALAVSLRDTRVRPNYLTLACGGCMLLAALIVAAWAPAWPANIAAALLLAAALVLDTADGHLARIQKTATRFGRWLDAVFDEAADIALHVGAAWALFRATGQPMWLLAATAYVAAKSLFTVACQNTPTDADLGQGRPDSRPDGPTAAIRLFGHADLRWHLWIVLALAGWLWCDLLAYTAYYATRAALVGMKGRKR